MTIEAFADDICLLTIILRRVQRADPAKVQAVILAYKPSGFWEGWKQ